MTNNNQNQDRVTKEMVSNWLKQAVTQKMLGLVKEVLEDNEHQLTGLVLNGPSLSKQDLHVLSQLKGQILALRMVLETKEFLSVIVTEEVLNEIQSKRTESSNRSEEI